MIPAHELTGLILAGGEGRRMGGRDKGLEPFAGCPLVTHVGQRFNGQVAELLISANRHTDTYRLYADRVIEDHCAGFNGPLMGLYAGLCAASTPWLLVAPCDTPALPMDLAARLTAGIGAADVAVAHDGERAHPVVALLHTRLAPALRRALDAGERSVAGFYAGQRVATINMADCPAGLTNVNTPDDRARLEATLAREAS